MDREKTDLDVGCFALRKELNERYGHVDETRVHLWPNILRDCWRRSTPPTPSDPVLLAIWHNRRAD